MVIDNAPEKLRGELTRWLLEVKPGVLVGKTSAAVREKLWEKVNKDGKSYDFCVEYYLCNEETDVYKNTKD